MKWQKLLPFSIKKRENSVLSKIINFVNTTGRKAYAERLGIRSIPCPTLQLEAYLCVCVCERNREKKKGNVVSQQRPFELIPSQDMRSIAQP